jgi:hypothetical protein
MIGRAAGIDALMTMMASLILATHLIVGTGLVLAEFAWPEPEAA